MTDANLGAPDPPVEAVPAVDRPIADRAAADLRVARILLRAGNALPARVQLETLVGRRQLDLPGMLDLAESRWRTGDLDSAGEAVTAYLEAGGTQPLAFLIAAEATSAAGRPGEARKLARQALQGLAEPLDAVFAGQPRSAIWPRDPAEPIPAVGTLFSTGVIDAAHGGRIGLTAPASRTTSTAGPASSAGRPASAAVPSPAGVEGRGRTGEAEDSAGSRASSDWMTGINAQPDRGLWDDSVMPVGMSDMAPDGSGQDPPEDAVAAAPGQGSKPLDVSADLDAARSALAAGDTRAAAMHLSIVLRTSPTLAPAVLDLVGELPGADLDLLRGDAFRLVGREAAAERAYAAAADALRGPATTRSPE